MLTRSGFGASVAAVVLAIAGWSWHYEELVIVAAVLIAALAVAVWGSRVTQQAHVRRLVTAPRVARGDPIRAIYRITNPTRRRVAPVTIIDRCDEQSVRVDTRAIGPDDRDEVVGLIPTQRRGVFDIGPAIIERRDPMGLAVGRRVTDQVGRVIVHPKIYRLHGPYGSMHVVEDEAIVRSAASDPLSGFVSLREYVPGDDPRLIHWPTSARMGTLMLREHVELRRPEFTVVLDAVRTVATPEDFEEMVDVAASIAAHALANGVTVHVRTTARRWPGVPRALDHDTQVLDLLTPVELVDPSDSFAIGEIFRGGFDHTAVVVVTGPSGPSTALANTDRMSVIRIGDGATTSAGVALAVGDAEEFVQRWTPWR